MRVKGDRLNHVLLAMERVDGFAGGVGDRLYVEESSRSGTAALCSH
jgi:hypothetical protein